jgi:uncharacterized protein YraI
MQKILSFTLSLALLWALLPTLPSQAQTCTPPNWEGKFYNSTDLSGVPVFTACDRAINFNWGVSAPVAGIGADNFSVRWTSIQSFSEAGNYTFNLTFEDGARLYINGTPLINAFTENEGARTLTAVYNVPTPGATAFITLEVVNFVGNAQIQLSWALAAGTAPPANTTANVTTTTTTAPGSVTTAPGTTVTASAALPAFGQSPTGGAQPWTVEFFNNPTREGTALVSLTELPDGINRNYGTNPPSGGLGGDFWSAKWSRQVDFPDGIYTFTLRADDGAVVRINGVEIINQGGFSENRSQVVRVQIPAGRHTISVDYFEAEGDANLFLTWEPPIGTTLFPDGCNSQMAGINGIPNVCAATSLAAAASLPVTVDRGPLNFRSSPNKSAGVLQILRRGQQYTAVGRSADNIWVQLDINGTRGWCMSEFLTLGGDINSLAITDGTSPAATTSTTTTTTSPTDSNPGTVAATVLVLNADGTSTTVTAPVDAGANNAATTPIASVRARAVGNMRVRDVPNDNGNRVAGVAWGQEVELIGRSADGLWFKLVVDGVTGWSSSAWYEVIQGDVNALPISN